MIITNKNNLIFEEFKEQNQNIDGPKRIGSIKNVHTGNYLTEMSIEEFRKIINTDLVFVEIPHEWEKKHAEEKPMEDYLKNIIKTNLDNGYSYMVTIKEKDVLAKELEDCVLGHYKELLGKEFPAILVDNKVEGDFYYELYPSKLIWSEKDLSKIIEYGNDSSKGIYSKTIK